MGKQYFTAFSHFYSSALNRFLEDNYGGLMQTELWFRFHTKSVQSNFLCKKSIWRETNLSDNHI